MLAHPGCAARLDARLLFGFTIGDASAHTCVHFCRHGLRCMIPLHFLPAVHNLLLSRNLQPGRGDALHRPLRWGLDVSGISQSRAENRCNPPSSPSHLCKTRHKAPISRPICKSSVSRRVPRATRLANPPTTDCSASPPSPGHHNLALALLSNRCASLCKSPARNPPSRPRSEIIVRIPRVGVGPHPPARA